MKSERIYIILLHDIFSMGLIKYLLFKGLADLEKISQIKLLIKPFYKHEYNAIPYIVSFKINKKGGLIYQKIVIYRGEINSFI